MVTVLKITEGQTGQQVADRLYDNDSALATAVNQVSEIVGAPEVVVLPTASWLAQGWNNSAQAGFVFVDIRAVVDADNLIQKVNIYGNTAGTVRIGFYDKNTLVRTSYQDVTITLGFNTFNVSFSNPNEHYVAFEGLTGEVALVAPTAGNAYGRRINAGALTAVDYPFAYTIETLSVSDTLAGRVTALEDIVGVGSGTDINQALEDRDVVTLKPMDYYLTENVVVPSGKTIRGSFGKTRIFLNGAATIGFDLDNVNDVKISDLEIIGTLPNYDYGQDGPVAGSGYTLINSYDQAIAFTNIGGETGIKIDTCERVIIKDIKVRNISGFAMDVIGVGKTYIWGMKTSDVLISNCYGGVRTSAEHEYSHYVNMSITLCQIAVACASGNLMFNNISCTRGMVGMMYTTGYNHAHGMATAIEAKHNRIAGILMDSIQYGQFLNGVYLSYCNLVIRNSRGVFASPAMFEGGAAIICTGNFPNPATPTVDFGKNVVGSVMVMQSSLTVSGGGNIVVDNMYNGIASV